MLYHSALKKEALRAAATNFPVMISGESGTGKELVARAIHTLSERTNKEFVPVDCSALVESLLESELFGHVKGSFTGAFQTKHGLFELANHGTFFFDEISNLSLNIQAKLLRVIQEREFMKVGSQKRIKLDIRIIASTNRDLEEAIKEGAVCFDFLTGDENYKFRWANSIRSNYTITCWKKILGSFFLN